MENATTPDCQRYSCDFGYTVILSMLIQASLEIRSFSRHYGGLSSVHHVAHLFELHICTSFSSLIAHTLSKAISSFLIQDLLIFVTGDPIDNVNQVGSLFF